MSERKFDNFTQRVHDPTAALINERSAAYTVDLIEEKINRIKLKDRIESRVFSLLGEKYKSNRIKSISYKMWVYDLIILIATILSFVAAVVGCERNLWFRNAEAQLSKVELNFFSEFINNYNNAYF